MTSEINKIDRRSAMSRVGLASIGVVVVAASSVIENPAIAQNTKIRKPENSTWFERVARDRKLLVPYFRAVASAIERDSPEPLNAYRRANPDYPADGPGALKKICWACLGRVLVAVGEWLQKI